MDFNMITDVKSWISYLVMFAAFFAPKCDCEMDVNEESHAIKSLCEKLEIRNVILLTADESSGVKGDLHNTVNLQRRLNEMTMFYTSITYFTSLEMTLVKARGTRVLVVVHLNSESLECVTEISWKIDMTETTWLCLSFSTEQSAADFENVFVPFNVEFFHGSVKYSDVELKDVYQLSVNSSKIINYYGTWNSSEGLHTVEGDLFTRRRNLHQIELTFVVVNLTDPIHPCTMDWEDEIHIGECLCFTIWQDLSNIFNFTSAYIVMPSLYENGTRGTSSPALDEVRSHKADASIELLALTPERLLHNAFFWPIFDRKMYIYTMMPEVEMDYKSYLQPFDNKLWMAIVAWFVSTAATLIFTKFIILKLLMKKRGSFLGDYAEELTASLSSLCSQSTSVNDGFGITIRIVISVIHLMPLLLLPAYSGGLTSSLTSRINDIPFTNLMEFEQDGRYKLFTEENTYISLYLRTEPQLQSLREKNLLSEESIHSQQDGFLAICGRKLSFITYQPIYLQEPTKCKLFVADSVTGPYFASMAVRKDFPFLEPFKRVVQKRLAWGLYVKEIEKIALDKVKIKIVYKSAEAWSNILSGKRNEHTKPFTFLDVLPIFVIYSAGLVLSIVILIIEICNEKC